VVTRPLSPFDRRVYHQIAVYAPGEAVAWPSQQTIADDLGCSRYSVHRAIHRLITGGWLEITERRPGRRGWTYCVYALLAPFAVSRWAIRPIVERARRHRQNGLHTNPKGWKRRDVSNGAPQRSAEHAGRPGNARSPARGSP
jgi:DNA-binding transcriptional MocR family regulator